MFANLVEGQVTPDLEHDDLALLGGQELQRIGESREPRVGFGLKPAHRIHIVADDLLAGGAPVAATQEIKGGAAERGHHEGVRVTGQVTLMFPKTYKCLLDDVVRIGLAPGPLARDEPEPGAVFGEPGPPVLCGMGVVHACHK